MKVRFFEIAWDVDDEFDDVDDDDELDLPTEVVVDNVDDDADLDLEGADILSDEVGFFVLSFEFEIVV